MLTLKQFRAKHKLTQKQLSQEIGITATTLSMYENGRWAINQAVIDWVKSEYGEDIRLVQRRGLPKRVWMRK